MATVTEIITHELSRPDVLWRLSLAFDQLVVTRFEAQLQLERLPDHMREQLPPEYLPLSVVIQDGLDPDDMGARPKHMAIVDLGHPGTLGVIFQSPSQRRDSACLIERIQDALAVPLS